MTPPKATTSDLWAYFYKYARSMQSDVTQSQDRNKNEKNGLGIETEVGTDNDSKLDYWVLDQEQWRLNKPDISIVIINRII